MEKGNIIRNKFITFTCALLLMNIISFVCITGQEKDQKKYDIKSEQTNNKTETIQVKQESEEKIEPPEGEQWVEPGDEKLYRFDINPITPKEGIKGGILIYLGHYARPPYRIEVNDNLKNGNFNEVEVKINGLVVSPIPLVIQDKYLKRKVRTEINLSKEEQDCFKRNKMFFNAIENDIINIGKKIGLKKGNIKRIEDEIKKYLQARPEIISFEIDSIWAATITYKICKEETSDIYFAWESYLSEKNESGIIKDNYEIGLSHINSVTYIWFDKESYGNQDTIYKVSMILNSPKTKEEKIKSLYELTYNLKYAKLLFYNFNYINYLNDKKNGLLK